LLYQYVYAYLALLFSLHLFQRVARVDLQAFVVVHAEAG
jgi:hypothetical protein